MSKYAHIIGWSQAVPSLVLTNDDMAKIVETIDQWILEHTDIRQRHIAGPDETVCTLSLEASRRALRHAGLSAKDLNLISLATSPRAPAAGTPYARLC